MRRELSRAVPLLVLFAIGLGAGTWILVSPWALGYPAPSGWTPSIWASVWVGALVAGASGVSLVAVLARALHLAVQPEPGRE